MKVLISQYIKTLKERNELDRLLPNLLVSMGIVPLFTTQTGTRQYGVDIAAVGKDPEDGIKKVFLFVIKQKDLGRKEWDSGINSIRPSLNEVFDVYIKNHLLPEHKKLPKKIILSTSGDMKEELSQSWAGYIDDHKIYEFDFWGASQLANLIENYMLNEHIFNDEDRTDLRRSLSLICENDYARSDFHRLLLRTLQLDANGKKNKDLKHAELEKSLRTCYLATNILAHWAMQDGNVKQALFVSERCLLWVWHRINLEENPQRYFQIINVLWDSYNNITNEYFLKIQPYCYHEYLISSYSRESSLISLTIFEQIGILANIGLNNFFVSVESEGEKKRQSLENANIVVDSMISLINNNPASGSPRLDENVIDIVLAFTLLILLGKLDAAEEWLKALILRLNFVFRIGRNHPISTDSLEDLICLDCDYDDSYMKDKTTRTSWLIPTLMGMAIILNKEEGYNALLAGIKQCYPKMCSQLWHPTCDLYEHLYFHQAQYVSGETEAPITFPDEVNDYRTRMREFGKINRYNIFKESSAAKAGLTILDFIAYRHFRTPVPAAVWYKLLRK